MSLNDKVALVTGAARGMGRAIAIRLANEGARVVATDINGKLVEQTSIDIRELGHDAIAVEADIGDVEDIDRVVVEALNAFGRIDILVNNAGITRHADIMDLTVEDWDRIHRVNARGVFFCLQRAAREMIGSGRGGRIINIASIAGKGYSGTSNAAYAASKGAVLAMTQIAAHQLGGYDINVNAICPGRTLTEMSRATAVQRSQDLGIPLDELEEQRNAIIPIGRANEPEDIAEMAMFLAGPGSRNITGQAFNVDGGLVMH
ncbi:MAG: 3-oxoacyl-ACP reductase FabG [Dehalococcoidia bacterium]|nr:3-oxoacyl-ACP reductase FabG [Dehalococcoidia bacterium]